MESEVVKREFVSVIIPVYNCKAYIEKCIRSVLSQTYPHLEVLVIDDGSTDGSEEILQRLKEEDERIILIRQDNAGVSAARNAGLDAATGTWLTFVDGDDYIDTNYVETLVKFALERNLDMVLCGLQKVTEDERVLEKIIPGKYERFVHEEWLFRISAVCSHLYKRSLWERYGMRFACGVRGEDIPVSLFFAAMCPAIGSIEMCGYYYIQHEGSAMSRFRGLEAFQLPYQELERVILAVQNEGISNGQEFFELFVLRILATFYFQLAPGASLQKMEELCGFIQKILHRYFPNYAKNPKVGLLSDLDIPFSQKVAVKLLILLVRTGLLGAVGRVMSRSDKNEKNR